MRRLTLAAALCLLAVPAGAATRLYFPASSASDVNPAFNGWADSTQGVRRELANTKGSSAIAAGTTIDITEDTGNRELDRQYVSNPMIAGVVFTSGSTTVASVVMMRELAGTDDVDKCILSLRVFSEDGNTLRATILTLGNYGPVLEFVANASHRNKRCADGDTLTGSYTTVAGDRLVVEVGYAADGAETTPQASAKWGENATDCAENETNTTDCAGWIELSNTITFVAPATRRVVTVTR